MIESMRSAFLEGPVAANDVETRTFRVRQDERRPLSTAAGIRHKVGILMKGTLTDVSETGCRIEIPFSASKAGQPIFVHVDGMEPWKGIIRWIRPDAIGVEFVHSLYGPVVDHLARTRAPVSVRV